MNKVRLNEDGDPIFYLLDITFPLSYPAPLTGELRDRFLYLVRQFFQLQHLWEVQLRSHRNAWNIRAAHDFWCAHGTATVHGRRFGWSERWLVDALDEVRAEIRRLEETADRIRNAVEVHAARRRAGRPLMRGGGMPSGRDEGRDEGGGGVDSSSHSETEQQESSPTHKPPRRPPGQQQGNHQRSVLPGLGTRERPIMIAQESDGGVEHPNQTDVVHQENVDPRGLSSSPDVRVHHRATRGHRQKSDGSANSRGSTSTSPGGKKRSRIGDAGLDGRPSKSPKHHSNSHAGSDSSDCDSGLSLIDEEA
ncbi:hypothetical protein VTN02DRAFT_2967 [Thermoascus thermophilus]